MPTILGTYIPDVTTEMLKTLYNLEPPIEQKTCFCLFTTPHQKLRRFLHRLQDGQTLSLKLQQELQQILTAGLKENKHHVFILFSILVNKTFNPTSGQQIISALQILKEKQLLHCITQENMQTITHVDDFHTAIETLHQNYMLNEAYLQHYLKPGYSLDKLATLFSDIRTQHPTGPSPI